MTILDRSRWLRLWKTLGGVRLGEDFFESFSKAYAEPHRAYHTDLHITDCLSLLDEAVNLAQNPLICELALWLHDLVYDTKAPDNEEKSAELGSDMLARGGVPQKIISPVASLILATKHESKPETRDGKLLVDIDLGVLGRDEKAFFKYENQIRKEYEWVPEDMYKEARISILNGFLKKNRIYHTEFFFNKFEKQARINLEKSVSILGGK